MNRCVLYLLLGLSSTALGAGQVPVSPDFLSGCWQADGAEPGSGEWWSSRAGGTLLGVGRTLNKGATVHWEFMQLREEKPGEWAFIALPRGQQETRFGPAASSTPETLTFENAGHDFPQRVSYRNLGGGKVLGRIEGKVRGELKVIDFPLTAVACPGPTSPKQP